MSRVLVTGGAGAIGAALVRRLLTDADYEVRVSDRRPVAQWMREGCEVHSGDLRVARDARAAIHGCSQVIHLAALGGGMAGRRRLPHALTEANNAIYNAVIRAALGAEVERFVYVSSGAVFERAALFPTPEAYLEDCPSPTTAYGFSKLSGEMYCRAALAEHGLPFTVCRAFNAYGPGELPDTEPGVAHVVPDLIERTLAGQRPLEIYGTGEQTRTLTHVEDLADGIVTAMGAPAGLNEDFNISAEREVSVAELAGIVWEACGKDRQALELDRLPAFPLDVQRRWPSVEKAQRLLGWSAKITLEDGIAATVRWLRGVKDAERLDGHIAGAR
ncbi:MAG: NAD-dependent epimerase/dehydratase family protein [Solirubrobacteraceae bacterium]